MHGLVLYTDSRSRTLIRYLSNNDCSIGHAFYDNSYEYVANSYVLTIFDVFEAQSCL